MTNDVIDAAFFRSRNLIPYDAFRFATPSRKSGIEFEQELKFIK